MSLNSKAVNAGLLNGGGLGLIGIGQLIAIEQATGFIESGELISLEQDVVLQLSSSESEAFISIEQGIQAKHVNAVAQIEQRSVDATVLAPVVNVGWDATLSIGGNTIAPEYITGDIEINRTENDAALMSVTLLPAIGIQDVEGYHGKTITLDVHTTNNSTNRVFTGVVDIPDIDILEEKITLRCTDRRTEQLNDQLENVVGEIGVWNSQIFRTPRDTAEEVEQRLTTTPYAVDFDSYGNYTITPWLPKSTADYTLTDSDVYYDRPRVEVTSRGRITNKVNIAFQYRYERFYHHSRRFTWTSSVKSNVCNLLQHGFSMTHKSTVYAAISAAGWPVKEEVDFDAIWPSGVYRCGGRQVIWSTTQIRRELTPKVDEEGNQVVDSNGNNVFDSRITGGTNYENIYCMGARWWGTTRWAQSVTENYTLSVQAPQSETQFGTIDQDTSYGIYDESDVGSWENYTRYDVRDFTSDAVGNQFNYYLNKDIDRDAFNESVLVALQQAKTTILGSHRDTRVVVGTFIWPEVDLKHTVLVDTDEVEAKGKVFNIRHRLNISTGEATTQTTLVLSRIQGSASEDDFVLPTIPSDSVTWNQYDIVLGNHFGQDPTTTQAAKWNGMIGNRWITESNNTYKTTYVEQFIVDTPSIPEDLRDARTLDAEASYNVEIPNDTLVITFDGK